MKYLITFVISMLIFCSYNRPAVCLSATSYARVLTPTNILRLSSNDETKDIICIAEKTYFVEILSERDNYYKVNYNGISGHIKKNDVKEILQIPKTPYPTQINIVIGSDCNLRSTPTTKSSVSNIINVVNNGETNIEFVGRVFAEEAIDFGGTTWYYVKFNGEYGYIYNKYVKTITPIYENTELTTFKSEASQTPQNPISHIPSLLLIIIMAVPIIAILFILYLPNRAHKKIKTPKPPKIVDRY